MEGSAADGKQLRGAVRASLERLKERSASIDWHVHESAQSLLRLRCVTHLLPAEGERNGDDEAEHPTALRRVLTEEIAEIDDPPSRHRLLVVLLDTAGHYEGSTLKERRTVIGQTFRGPSAKAISWGTVRKHHEPRALDELADRIVARELRGHKL